jgi:speckle-type POZ protein
MSTPSAVGGGLAPPAHTTSSIFVETMSGSHVLKINGYSLINGLGVDKFIDSGRFSVGGRSWVMRYYPQGWDKEDADYVAMSLFLVDTHGPDVKVRYRFSLLDQDEGIHVPMKSEAGLRYTYRANTGSGYGRFLHRKALEESTYLRDDSLEIRCDVTVIKGIRVTEAVSVTTRFVAVPPSDMHHHFGGLLSSGQGADVTFEVGGEKFAAHPLVETGSLVPARKGL